MGHLWLDEPFPNGRQPMPICTVRVCTVRATAAAGACAALLLASGTPAAQAARVAQAAQAARVAQAAQAARASVPGWRIVSTDHRAGIDLELAVAAIGRRNAWAGGGVSPSHTSQGRPFAEHWNGRRWRTSRLPGRLSGAITLLRTSAWNNVWAFGGKPSQPGATLQRSPLAVRAHWRGNPDRRIGHRAAGRRYLGAGRCRRHRHLGGHEVRDRLFLEPDAAATVHDRPRRRATHHPLRADVLQRLGAGRGRANRSWA